jgi:hypothetical protein
MTLSGTAAPGDPKPTQTLKVLFNDTTAFHGRLTPARRAR